MRVCAVLACECKHYACRYNSEQQSEPQPPISVSPGLALNSRSQSKPACAVCVLCIECMRCDESENKQPI